MITVVRRSASWLRQIVRWICPFEFGAFGPLTVRKECVDLKLGRRVRLLYASDLHLGHWWSRRVPTQLIDVARQTRPDLILLGGDLADRRDVLGTLCECIRELAAVATIAAVPGNHDERTGIGEIRTAVESGGGVWLPSRSLKVPFHVDGEIKASSGSEPRLLCAHYPSVFPAAVRAGYRLVLAGHLHGGQCVLATIGGRLYPAAWIHRWHVLRFANGDSVLIVSRGVADTLPVRLNCPREVILCEIT